MKRFLQNALSLFLICHSLFAFLGSLPFGESGEWGVSRCFAQSPQAINYQAVARDASGNPIANTSIAIRFSLYNSVGPDTVWIETHSKTTNQFGLFTAEIGQGVKIGGSKTFFSNINWGSGVFYLRVWINGNDMGFTQFISVPYALHAATADSLAGGPGFIPWTKSGTNVSLTTSTDKVGIGASFPSDKLVVAGGGLGGITVRDQTDVIDAIKLASGTGVSASGSIALMNSGITTVSFSGIGTNYFNAGNVGIGTVSPAEKLDVSGNVQFSGALMPNSTAGTNGQVLTSAGAGIFPTWQTPTAATFGGWAVTGNSGTIDGTNFIGTTDNIPFNIRVNNQKAGRIDNTLGNTVFGYQALNANTTGSANTAIGMSALTNNTTGTGNTANGDAALFSNTTGNNNTANGFKALSFNTTGNENTANGMQALNYNTTGSYNTANGMQALFNNTTGVSNSANGTYALFSNATGDNNTANGFQVLYYNTAGSQNTAIGMSALTNNTTGTGNTANGVYALQSNVAGNNGVALGYYSQQYANNTATGYDNTNTSVGYQSLRGSTTASANTGISNTAIGRDALFSNTTGNNNTANGSSALSSNTTGVSNTASGQGALSYNTTGSYNTANGSSALSSNTTGTSNTASGHVALYLNTIGSNNTANGMGALNTNTTGNDNTASGANALSFNTTGSSNTASGVSALSSNTTGINNTALGVSAGYNTTLGSGNVFLGYNAGFSETGSNKLYIANNSTNPPLIYGDFASGNVGIGTTTPATKLHIGTTGSDEVRLGKISFNTSTNAVIDENFGPRVMLAEAGGGSRFSVYNSTPSLILSAKSNQRVGILTDIPGSALSVSGNISIGSSYAGTAAPASGAIIEGSVGIGTNSPGALLDIGPSINPISLRVTNTSVSAGVAAFINNTSAGNGNPALQVQVANSLAPSATFIGGGVGIGTLSPQATLQLSAPTPRFTITNSTSITTSNTQLSEIWFNDAANSNPQAGIRVFRDVAVSGGDAPTAMVFYTTNVSNISNSEKMRINNAGNVGIGSSGPISTLKVVGSIAGNFVTPSSLPYTCTPKDYFVFVTAGGAGGVILPLANSVDAGSVLIIRNQTAGSVTVSRNGATDLIFPLDVSSGQTSVSISNPGGATGIAAKKFISNGVNQWIEW